jgi:hypothetical protein
MVFMTPNAVTLVSLAYSLTQAVEITGLSRSTLKRCILSGELRVRKVRTRTIIDAEELRRFIYARPLVEPVSKQTKIA